ncbi:hypothetical protein [Haloarcula marina]|uniref:hypothetical protein n=1 Tax=Haloarcula marina TaxID=2961574 RepID=UPI0020B725F3|nr:hypothetical protein [Halomicroarcula marina]
MQVSPAGSVAYLTALALFVVAWVAVGYAFYADASARGTRWPLFWSVVSVLFLPAAAYYLVSVRRRRTRSSPVTRTERAARVVGVASIGATVVGSVLAPPDPLSAAVLTLGAFAVLLPTVYFLAVRRWGGPRLVDL